MKVHLVDGTYELFRAYYGAPASSAPDGREVGAVRGLLRSLLRLVKESGATHVACAFDTVIESFRNDLFDGYKTGEGIEPELWAQFPLAEQAAKALGMVVWSMVEFETDDALCTGAARFAADPRVEQVVICSPDKDFAQCVKDKRVVLWDRMRDLVYDQAGVVEKWGVNPSSIPDWLALVGDDADGIPGVPRWGKKSAATVLDTYRRVEDIPDSETEWSVKVRGAKSLGENLRESRVGDKIGLYKTLATLRSDVPLTEGLDDLEWQGANREALSAFCAEIGDEGFVQRVPRFVG